MRFGGSTVAALASVLLGCSAYQPGALADHPGVHRAALRHAGCLELAATWVDAEAVPTGSALVDLHLGNACPHPVEVSAQHVRVTSRTTDGDVQQLALFDPRREVITLRIDGATSARERLRFDAPEPRGGVASLCVELEGVPPPDERAPLAPICFRRGDDDVVTPVAEDGR